MATEVVLVRHGVTEWNKKRWIQGQTDIPLSDEGIKQAEELAKRAEVLGVSTIYSFPLLRALETSKRLGDRLKIPIVIHGGLRERSYGEFEGRLFDEVNNQLKNNNTPLKLYSLRDGESYSDFKIRVIAAFNKIINKHKNEKILFVCHGGVLEVLAKYLSKTEDRDKENDDIGYAFANASILIFSVQLTTPGVGS